MVVKIKVYSEFGEDDAIVKLNKKLKICKSQEKTFWTLVYKYISTEAVQFICTIGNKEEITMDAVKYLKEVARMNHKGASGACGIDCNVCPLGKLNNGKNIGCNALEARYPEKSVEIVKKWSDEHPQKTYLMDFLEKFPNCVKDTKGFPVSCRKFIYPLMSRENCSGLNCSECWNEPMEDKR